MSRVLIVGVVAALVTLSGCGSAVPTVCQPQPSGNGPYTVKLTNGGAASANCPAVVGDLWFIEQYAKPEVPTGANVVFRSGGVALPKPPDANSTVYGKGVFTATFPDANDICTVAKTDNPFDAPGPAGSKYDITDVAFLSTALYIGTEFKANVTYTVGGTGEVCNYTAQALNPTTECTSNTDCDPLSQPVNSGINYLYDQGCNMDPWALDLAGDGNGICFFNKEFPSLGGFHP